jgi:hypothetical protein
LDRDEQPSDEAEAIRQVQRTAAALTAKLRSLANLPREQTKAERSLDGALANLGDISVFSAALAELADQAGAIAKNGHARRAERTRAAVSTFVRASEPSHGAREGANGWRVGRLAIEIRLDDGLARLAYNREPLGSWQPIGQPADLERMFAAGEKQLGSAEIPPDALAETFIEAYDYLASKAFKAATTSKRIRLIDLLDEIRVVRARNLMRAKRRKDADAAISLPVWALLYNADLYRAQAGELPPALRLVFETGSQNETEKYGVTLNGLEPTRDYQRFCFVRRVGTE